MAAFTLTKAGTLFGTSSPAYFPCIIDTSAIANWPWTITLFSSTDHSTGGIYMYGANGDPTVAANWESYNTALAAGRFDAFGTKPAANPVYNHTTEGSDCETSHAVKVGATYDLTTHILTGASTQPTILATSTDLLNWTDHDNGSASAQILTGTLTADYPNGASMHHGYFRRGANPFAGIAYAHVGYGLLGGGDQYHYCLYGSDDGKTWAVVSVLDRHVDPDVLPSGWEIKWNEIDPQSIRDAGNGEYVALCTCGNPASGSASRNAAVYEIYLAADGYTVTRQPRLILARGAAASADENEVAQPTSLVYNGTLLCVYQGADSTSANSLMLATGSVTATATKPTSLSRPNHDKYTVAHGDGALPASMEADGTAPTFAAGYISLPAGGGIRLASTSVPSTAGWYEVYVHSATGTGSTCIPLIQVGDTGPGDTANGVMVNSFGSIGNRIQMRSRASSATVQSVNAEYLFYTQQGRLHRNGLRWHVSDQQLYLLGNGVSRHTLLSVPGAPTGSSLRPRVGAATAAWRILSLTMRVGTTGAGVAPTVTAAANATTVTLTLSENCIGDGTGLTVKAGASAVEGTWTRTGLTNLTFTRSSGQFTSSDTITYDVASTDVRNEDDLVAVQDVSGAGVTNNAPSASAQAIGSPVSFGDDDSFHIGRTAVSFG